ncbi:peptidase [Serinibacter arcticus]|uniref:Peptidase n=1 Tax=Serinibacter arcticus TaxID=1655435 RepID=A0A2U1ZSX0_9MICO|nr:M23 family metallopeptidase [Serinibacter arcticus]PWD50085.1 peptidase [Serinibacter arcticus]
MPSIFRVLGTVAAVAALAATATVAGTGGGGGPGGGGQGGGGAGDAGPAGAAARPAVAAAPRPAARGAEAAVVYDWPLPAPAVVRAFDDPAQPWLAGHRGVDLAASAGAPVHAAADGVVAFAGTVAGRGVVSLDHADGIRTTYEPVTPAVARGEAVLRGDVIGTLVPGHRQDGTDALHWGARIGRETYVDPTLLVAGDVVIRLWE